MMEDEEKKPRLWRRGRGSWIPSELALCWLRFLGRGVWVGNEDGRAWVGKGSIQGGGEREGEMDVWIWMDMDGWLDGWMV